MLSGVDGVRSLAAYMASRRADRVTSRSDKGHAEVKLLFEH